jgi:CRISPR-associated protein Cas4
MSATTTDLIPLRALNQVGYCERLYYLEYVDAVMPTNEFVEDGLFQHRRVNSADLENVTRKEGDALKTRSVSLSSEKLGLTGKLDLVEEKGGRVYPVEYKRSTAPKDDAGRPTFWENDALQLCGQALLLEEEMGITIERSILYCVGSRERVEVPLDEELRAKTFAAIEKKRISPAERREGRLMYGRAGRVGVAGRIRHNTTITSRKAARIRREIGSMRTAWQRKGREARDGVRFCTVILYGWVLGNRSR